MIAVEFESGVAVLSVDNLPVNVIAREGEPCSLARPMSGR
jgi:hypothetical protein